MSIYYLIDLYEKKLVETYEGFPEAVPLKARERAEAETKNTGHTYVIARGVEFHQDD